MKIILAGSTGFIGKEVLEQCIKHPSIISIIALTRSPLPEPAASNSKVKAVIIADYSSYVSSTLQAVEGADACIWTLGKAWISDNETTKTLFLEYTMAAARAFASQRGAAAESSSNKIRFVYLSGGAVERDQNKSLWFMQDYRRIRGQAETDLLAYGKDNSNVFETYIMKPGMVLQKQVNLRDMVRALAPSVPVDALAKVMVKVALDGFRQDTLDNTTIVMESKKL